MHRKETNQTGTRGGAHCIVSIPQVASISQNDSFLGRARLLLQCDGHRTLRIFLGRLVSTVAVPLGAYVRRLMVLEGSLATSCDLPKSTCTLYQSCARSLLALLRYTLRRLSMTTKSCNEPQQAAQQRFARESTMPLYRLNSRAHVRETIHLCQSSQARSTAARLRHP